MNRRLKIAFLSGCLLAAVLGLWFFRLSRPVEPPLSVQSLGLAKYSQEREGSVPFCLSNRSDRSIFIPIGTGRTGSEMWSAVEVKQNGSWIIESQSCPVFVWTNHPATFRFEPHSVRYFTFRLPRDGETRRVVFRWQSSPISFAFLRGILPRVSKWLLNSTYELRSEELVLQPAKPPLEWTPLASRADALDKTPAIVATNPPLTVTDLRYQHPAQKH